MGQEMLETPPTASSSRPLRQPSASVVNQKTAYKRQMKLQQQQAAEAQQQAEQHTVDES